MRDISNVKIDKSAIRNGFMYKFNYLAKEYDDFNVVGIANSATPMITEVYSNVDKG